MPRPADEAAVCRRRRERHRRRHARDLGRRAQPPLPRLLRAERQRGRARRGRTGRRSDRAADRVVHEPRVLRMEAVDPARVERGGRGALARRGAVRQGAWTAGTITRGRGRGARDLAITAAGPTGRRAARCTRPGCGAPTAARRSRSNRCACAAAAGMRRGAADDRCLGLDPRVRDSRRAPRGQGRGAPADRPSRARGRRGSSPTAGARVRRGQCARDRHAHGRTVAHEQSVAQATLLADGRSPGSTSSGGCWCAPRAPTPSCSPMRRPGCSPRHGARSTGPTSAGRAATRRVGRLHPALIESEPLGGLRVGQRGRWLTLIARLAVRTSPAS